MDGYRVGQGGHAHPYLVVDFERKGWIGRRLKHFYLQTHLHNFLFLYTI